MALTRTIKTANDAERIWQKFLEDSKLAFRSAALPLVDTAKKDSKANPAPLKQETANAADTEFKYFLGEERERVKLCTDSKKLAELQHSLANGDWKSIDYLNADLQPVILTLFAEGKVIPQQAYTLLRLMQFPSFLKKHNSSPTKMKVYPIFEKGKYTKAALDDLIPALNSSLYTIDEKQGTLETLRLLAAQIPLSEQCFFMLEIDTPQRVSLTTTLLLTGASFNLTRKGKLYYLYLPAALEDVIGITQFGLQRHVRTVPRLGMQSPKDVEWGVRHRLRPQAIACQDIPGYTKVHDYVDVVEEEASGHDKHHANVLSSLPTDVYHLMLYMADLVRHSFGLQWSREIWDWLDCDFRFFLNKESFNREFDAKETGVLFCRLFLRGNQNRDKEHSKGGYLTYPTDSKEYPFLSPVGSIIFLDMLTQAANWHRHHFDPANLIEPFKFFYDELKSILPVLKKEDSLEQKIFKCQLYFALKTINRSDCFAEICEMLAEINIKIAVKKIKSKDTDKYRILYPPNIFMLHFDDEKMYSYPNILLQLRNALIKAGYAFFARALFIKELTNQNIPQYVAYRKNKNTHEETMYALNPQSLTFLERVSFYLGFKATNHLLFDPKKPAIAPDKMQNVLKTDSKLPIPKG